MFRLLKILVFMLLIFFTLPSMAVMKIVDKINGGGKQDTLLLLLDYDNNFFVGKINSVHGDITLPFFPEIVGNRLQAKEKYGDYYEVHGDFADWRDLAMACKGYLDNHTAVPVDVFVHLIAERCNPGDIPEDIIQSLSGNQRCQSQEINSGYLPSLYAIVGEQDEQVDFKGYFSNHEGKPLEIVMEEKFFSNTYIVMTVDQGIGAVVKLSTKITNCKKFPATTGDAVGVQESMLYFTFYPETKRNSSDEATVSDEEFARALQLKLDQEDSMPKDHDNGHQSKKPPLEPPVVHRGNPADQVHFPNNQAPGVYPQGQPGHWPSPPPGFGLFPQNAQFLGNYPHQTPANYGQQVPGFYQTPPVNPQAINMGFPVQSGYPQVPPQGLPPAYSATPAPQPVASSQGGEQRGIESKSDRMYKKHIKQFWVESRAIGGRSMGADFKLCAMMNAGSPVRGTATLEFNKKTGKERSEVQVIDPGLTRDKYYDKLTPQQRNEKLVTGYSRLRSEKESREAPIRYGVFAPQDIRSDEKGRKGGPIIGVNHSISFDPDYKDTLVHLFRDVDSEDEYFDGIE